MMIKERVVGGLESVYLKAHIPFLYLETCSFPLDLLWSQLQEEKGYLVAITCLHQKAIASSFSWFKMLM